MIAKCHCTEKSLASLKKFVGLEEGGFSTLAEIEFRELPYFFVSRSRDKWMDGNDDVNAVRVEGANEFGILFNPGKTGDESKRTFVPWQNVISFSFYDQSAADAASSEN